VAHAYIRKERGMILKKLAATLLAVILLATVVVAAELKGTVEKLNKAKNRLVLESPISDSSITWRIF
jgi:hypothetical protein